MKILSRLYSSKQFKIFLAVLWLAIIAGCLFFSDNITIDNILSFTPEKKLLAVLIILLLFALKSISIFIYSGILFAAVGVMFKLPIAFLISILGSVVIATIPFLIGRKFGEGYIEKLEEKYTKLSIMKDIRSSNDFLFIILTRMIELIPYDIASLYMGAAGFKYKNYIIASVIGMMQVFVPMTLMGYAAEDTSSTLFVASACVQILLSIISVIVSLLYVKKIKSARKQ